MSRYVEALKSTTTCCFIHAKAQNTSKTVQQCKYMHSGYVNRYTSSITGPRHKELFKNNLKLYTPSVRYASTEPIDFLSKIPDAPPMLTSDFVEKAVALTEPTFASIDLGGWSPVGMVQNCMEFLHVGLDMPWYAAIALGTVVVRTLLFPLVLIAQRNAAKMNNHMPEMQVLQMKMTQARRSGNILEAARLGEEMMLFMKSKQLNPVKNMLVPLAQAPLFISFFMGLRGMANAPVESLKDGGLFWFADLTVPDPFYLLPIITSATMWLTIEVGADSVRLNAQNMKAMIYILRAMPIVILPFIVNFPGAILWYWTCTNFISLGQVAFLKIPKVRNYFNIEPLVIHAPTSLPMKSEGFAKGFRDSWTNVKISRQLEERAYADKIRLERASRPAIEKNAQESVADSTTHSTNSFSNKR